jgi:CRP/FNR family transcriptional regulator, cyclic AMP receptor protein
MEASETARDRRGEERSAPGSFPVDLFEHDPDLGEAVALGAGAPRVFAVPVVAGPWEPDIRVSGLGLLVLAGFVIRRVELAGRHSVELLGPGDLLRPWEVGDEHYAMVPSCASWRIIEPAHLAVLDGRFADWASGQSQLIDRLLSRLLRRSRTLALRLALVQLRQLPARLHFLLWHLADRFGRVHRDGVLLPLPLTHAMLADLVSAQRPPVSRAMKELERHGLLSPVRNGGWYLHGRPPAASEFGDPLPR